MIEVNYSREILQKNYDKGYIPKPVKDRLLTSHMNLKNAKLYLSKLDLSSVKEIMLIHLSDGNSDAKLFVKEIKALTGKPVRVL